MKNMKESYYDPCNQVQHITQFGNEQKNLAEIGIPIATAHKIQFYIKRVLASGLFEPHSII